ncbi:MAG: hypothetical protein JWN30_1984 [Bacilli bacterium]|nr:hypothetical protein [Bacilli bacterium]
MGEYRLKPYTGSKVLLAVLAVSLIMNVFVIGTGVYLYLKVSTPHRVQTSPAPALQASYPIETVLPISAVNQIVQQSLQTAPTMGTSSAHLSGVSFQFGGAQLITNVQVFLFGRTMNLQVMSRPQVLNGDVRLDMTSAQVSGFPLPLTSLFSILGSIGFPPWMRVDQQQQQVWLHFTGHRFGNFSIYVREIDPGKDRIRAGLSL